MLKNKAHVRGQIFTEVGVRVGELKRGSTAIVLKYCWSPSALPEHNVPASRAINPTVSKIDLPTLHLPVTKSIASPGY